MHLLFATGNAHKAAEVRALLDGTGIRLTTLADRPDLPEPDEPFDTFEANALAKARAIFERTRIPVIADDSGLEVDALDGAPGVHSKRFSPEGTHEANNALLLQRLNGTTVRAARFRCVLAIKTATFEGTVEGVCPGQIVLDPRGTQGFGYDPVFAPDELHGRTMAEATMTEKNAISHRGRAFRELPALLRRAGMI